MKTKQIVLGTLAIAAPLALAIAAVPHLEADNDALSIAGAKTTLAEAVAVAERHAGGKAAKAEFERSSGRWVFDIEVVKDKTVFDVKVAADDATVLSSKEDHADHDDDKDDRD